MMFYPKDYDFARLLLQGYGRSIFLTLLNLTITFIERFILTPNDKSPKKW